MNSTKGEELKATFASKVLQKYPKLDLNQLVGFLDILDEMGIPDMYEALKTATKTIEYLHNMGIPSESQKMMWALYQKSPEMTKINKAIAKAEVNL